MDFLNKAFSQASDLFRSMTPAARITSGLLLGVVVVSLFYLFRYHVSGPDAYLLNGEPVPASQLPAMIEAFAKANLTSYEIQGARIRIPRGQQAAYMAALADGKALPASFGSSLREAQKSGNPFESKEQREHRIKVALQDELALIIRSMKGIESAYVLYDTETKSGLGREKAVTASVSVKPLGSESLSEEQVASIRHLVSGAIAGLKAQDVTVADLNGHVYHGDPQSGGGMAGENLYRAVKQMHERDLKGKILEALKFIPNLTVEASIVLDRDRINRTQTEEYKAKSVVLRSSEKTTTRSRESSSPGGRPGFQAQNNSPTAVAAASGKGGREEEDNSQREEINAPSVERVEKESVGLTPKLVKVSVGIPNSYFVKVWRERNPAKDGEEKSPEPAALEQVRQEETTKVRKHVATLLPTETTGDINELVTITSFQDIHGEAIPAPAMSQKALGWFGQHWSTIGLIGLGLVSLAMLRSMVRAAPAPPEPGPAIARSLPAEPEASESETPEAAAARRLKRATGSGPSLRDELSEMVKEDPDAAANILRAWIGQAG